MGRQGSEGLPQGRYQGMAYPKQGDLQRKGYEEAAMSVRMGARGRYGGWGLTTATA